MKTERRRSPAVKALIGGVVLAAAAAAPLVYFFDFPWYIPALVGVNVATLLLYGIDKLCAVRKWARIPERTLHIFAFAGGSPAAFLAQRVFRHKTRKKSFQVVFWFLVVIHVALIAWACWHEWGRGTP